jgi:transcriptional regulator with XRE-family HTH domain
MMNTQKRQTEFGRWLCGELESRDWGIRTLARRINPGEPEIARRALNRYVHEGTLPSPEYRAAIADALGVDVDELPGDDEDEEVPLRDDPLVFAVYELVAAIRKQVASC